MKQLEVVAAVLIHDGRVFAAQRGAGGAAAFKWEFPGGKVESGEGHREALCRELQEELGIQAAIGEHLVTVTHAYPSFVLTMHCYLARIAGGTIRLAEHLDSRWLAAGELDRLDWAPADRPVLPLVRKHLV